MRIKDVMTTRVLHVRSTDPVEAARAMMRLHGVGQLVVVDDHRVTGVVTAHQVEDSPQDGLTVENVMTRHIVVASPDLPLRKAANMLRGSAVSALPVIERGRLVGVVTVSDLLEMIGRGGVRPVTKGRRPTLKHRGDRPPQARVAGGR
jgi:CBS domain-containing protein